MADGVAAEATVLAAHQGLYDAIEAGDLDLMRSLWLPGEATVCVPFGGEPVRGTAAVLRAWAVIMANTGYIQFILTDVAVSRSADGGGTAVVSCTENVLSEASQTADSFIGGRAVASSVLVRTAGGWRFWTHHSSPVGTSEDDDR